MKTANTHYVAVTFTGSNRPADSDEDTDNRIYANERGSEDVSNALDAFDVEAEVREIDMGKLTAQRKRLKARNAALKRALLYLLSHTDEDCPQDNRTGHLCSAMHDAADLLGLKDFKVGDEEE